MTHPDFSYMLQKFIYDLLLFTVLYQEYMPCIEIGDVSIRPITLIKFEFINTQESGIFPRLFEMALSIRSIYITLCFS